jgi:membrane protease YdiL (CAAX protease family)
LKSGAKKDISGSKFNFSSKFAAMTNVPIQPNWQRVSTRKSLYIVLALTIVTFFFLGPFIALVITMPFYPGSFMDMISAMSNPLAHPEVKIPMMMVQGITTLLAFIVVPYFYAKKYMDLTPKDLFGKEVPSPLITILVFAIVIVFMIANSIFIEWNQNVQLPEMLSGLEDWARGIEDQAAMITEYLTSFTSLSDFLIALVVIAVLPAIGEELVFRGLVQNHIHILTKNVHKAVWISAIIFSFFHFQFFGFVPRMLLGALFGYLYVWSGNIAYPILAHFINNGFTLLMVYFYHSGAIEFDIESTETVPLTNALLAMVVTAVLLYLFSAHFRKQDLNEGLEDGFHLRD